MTQQWTSPEVTDLMTEAWTTRQEMQLKIQRRDAKKDAAAAEKPKKRKWQENDWYN